MLGILRRWRQNRERQIFHFWDGRRDRAADPIAVYRALVDHQTFSLEKHCPLADAGDSEAIVITVAAVREVFDVLAWSEKSPGLTEAECLGLLLDFLNYVGDLKKNTDEPAISPSATESLPSAPWITKPELVSGSISTEPSDGTPHELSLGSMQP